jgi:hypothetical protein
MAEKHGMDHLEAGMPSPGIHPQSKEDVPEGHVPFSPEEKALNRSLNRKLDFYLLPFLSLLYLFNGLDRGNVGNAQTQGKSSAVVEPKTTNR